MIQHRCRWCNLQNPLYVEYHDREWCVPQYNDAMLFELLLLESFQAGLSWEIILNKRENFRCAFDYFDPALICSYDDVKIQLLMENSGIIRNRRKIESIIHNAGVFLQIQEEWGSFCNYIWHFTVGNVIYEVDRTCSPLSDQIAVDLKMRGMKFIGSTTVYSYLQAIGIVYSHEQQCYLHHKIQENK